MRKALWLVLLVACGPYRVNTVAPEVAAQKFVDDLALKIQGKPNCAQVDTDNDGYVTCTIALVGKEGASPTTMSLQCAALVASDGCDPKYANGCKETQPKINVTNNNN
jgi:hypothetical protein